MTTSNTAERDIRTLVEAWLVACCKQDIAGITANYAEDIVGYDAILALRFNGLKAYKDHWQFCMDACPGVMIFEIPELQVIANDELGFCYGLIRTGMETDEGSRFSWMRVTIGWQKRAGRWQVIHEHFSAPFDMESSKALFDLTP